jgi:hypothetical protein
MSRQMASVTLEPEPLVTLVRCRTVAKVDSIGFVVRRWIQCWDGWSWNASSCPMSSVIFATGGLSSTDGDGAQLWRGDHAMELLQVRNGRRRGTSGRPGVLRRSRAICCATRVCGRPARSRSRRPAVISVHGNRSGAERFDAPSSGCDGVRAPCERHSTLFRVKP